MGRRSIGGQPACFPAHVSTFDGTAAHSSRFDGNQTPARRPVGRRGMATPGLLGGDWTGLQPCSGLFLSTDLRRAFCIRFFPPHISSCPVSSQFSVAELVLSPAVAIRRYLESRLVQRRIEPARFLCCAPLLSQLATPDPRDRSLCSGNPCFGPRWVGVSPLCRPMPQPAGVNVGC